MSGWRMHVLEPGAGLGAHAAEWDAANQRQTGNHPLLTSSFVGRLLEHFGDGRPVTLCQYGDDTGPQAACLLQRRGLGLWSTFLPAQTQLGPMIATELAVVESVVKSLPGFAVVVDVLCVDSGITSAPATKTTTKATPHALTMSVDLRGGFERYWADRPSHLRQNVRRYERRANDDALRPRFELIQGAADIESAVWRYADLESAGWKGKAGTALSRENVQGRFYRDVMVDAAQRGQGYVHEMYLGDQLAASRLIIESGSMLVTLKTTYDETRDRYAPGRLLLRHVLSHCFEHHSGKVLEFYTDATQDQLAWATAQRPIVHWSVYRSVPAAHAVTAVKVVRQALNRHPTIDLPKAIATEIHDTVDKLPDDARSLLDSAEPTSVQLGSSWYRALIRAVFVRAEIKICVVREHGTCVAVLPALAQRHWSGTRLGALSNYYTALYAPVQRAAAKPIIMVAALEALTQSVAAPAQITLAPMDPESKSFDDLWRGLETLGWVPFRFFCFGNWYLKVEQPWSAYEARLNSRLRNTLSRMRRRFDADGGRLEVVSEGTALESALQAYLHVYARSWKRSEPYPDFLPELVRQFGPSGAVRIGVAWLNGQPIAAQLWFVAGTRAEIYKLAHDQAFKHYSPGSLLTATMLKQVFDGGVVKEVDYLIGDDPYKKDWMPLRRERWGIVAYNPRTADGALGLAKEVTGRILKTLAAPVSLRKRR